MSPGCEKLAFQVKPKSPSFGLRHSGHDEDELDETRESEIRRTHATILVDRLILGPGTSFNESACFIENKRYGASICDINVFSLRYTEAYTIEASICIKALMDHYPQKYKRFCRKLEKKQQRKMQIEPSCHRGFNMDNKNKVELSNTWDFCFSEDLKYWPEIHERCINVSAHYEQNKILKGVLDKKKVTIILR